MSEGTPLDDFHADAIRWRIMQHDKAEKALSEAIDRVLRDMGMPDGSQIRIEAGGALVAVAPDDKVK